MADHRVFFSYDEDIKRTTWLVFDDKGNMKGAHVEQEVDAILDANAEMEKATHGTPFGDYRPLASVPLTFFEKSGIGEAIDAGDKRYLSKILNDADHKKFRTSRGRV
jgi:hypothetical protein